MAPTRKAAAGAAQYKYNHKDKNNNRAADSDSASETAKEAAAGGTKESPAAVMAKAMSRLDKRVAKRAKIRHEITKDHDARLVALKERIEAHYAAEAREMSAQDGQTLERLIAAISKRQDCEERINQRIVDLRTSVGHIAMLVDAVYQGRMETAAAASAREGGDVKGKGKERAA